MSPDELPEFARHVETAAGTLADLAGVGLDPASADAVRKEVHALKYKIIGLAYTGAATASFSPPGSPVPHVPPYVRVADPPPDPPAPPPPAPHPDAGMVPEEFGKVRARLATLARKARAVTAPEFRRLAPGAECGGCMGRVDSHPFDSNHRDEHGRPYLRIMCDGTYAWDGTAG